jgi:hypothetical protein
MNATPGDPASLEPLYYRTPAPDVIRAGTKLRFRGDDNGTLTGLASRPPTDGQVVIETLEDPPRTFTRTEGEVVVIGDEAVWVTCEGCGALVPGGACCGQCGRPL